MITKIKPLLAIFSACTLLFLAGCGEDTTKDIEDDIDSDFNSSESTVSSYKVGQTATLKNFKVTADSIKRGEGKDAFDTTDGNVFVGMHFTIENTSDDEQVISSMALFNAYADGDKRAYSVNAAIAFDGNTLDGTIAPGKKLEGYYAVEVPDTTEKLELEVQSSIFGTTKAKFVFEMPG